MGKKYSINSAGNIVAERDIYSLGGFIPKGSVGAKVANELQLSQDGECWIDSGDVSLQPNIRVKDNAFFQKYSSLVSLPTDVDIEISGNSLILSDTITQPLIETKSSLFVKDCYIATEHNLLCTPATNTAGFPFESGSYDADAAKGTPLADMKLANASFCRSIRESQEGKETYVYFPGGMTCRILWLYKDADGAFKYSGETVSLASNYARIYHPVYKYFVFYFYQVGLTIDTLESKGCRLIDRPSLSARNVLILNSSSGAYTMTESTVRRFLTDWSTATIKTWRLAGRLDRSNLVMGSISDQRFYGTFSDIAYLEHDRVGDAAHDTKEKRDKFVIASGCPLLRLDAGTYGGTIIDSGEPLVFRNCIVPKAYLTHNKVLGDTYENLDFSYAQEFLGAAVGNGSLRSSHTQGHYDVFSVAPSNNHVATVSRPGNAEASTIFGGDTVDLYLDGNIIEQGTYEFIPGASFEDCKIGAGDRVRMSRPVSTKNTGFPTVPAGYKVRYAYYLDESLIVVDAEEEPTSISADYPYVLLAFRREDSAALLSVSDFVKLNVYIRSYDYTHVPFISGNGYVGAGVTVRGDVQVIGQPYVDRIYDRNLWELGSVSTVQEGWEQAKNAPGSVTENNRLRFKELIPVKPGSVITCADGFNIIGYFYAEDGSYIMARDWGVTTTAPDNTAYLGIIIRKGASPGTTITLSDLVSAHVRCVEPFKTTRYITNELDRKNPNDILLTPDYWEQGSMSSGAAYDGKKYNELKTPYSLAIRLKKPINIHVPGQTTAEGSGFSVSKQYFDGETSIYSPAGAAEQAKAALTTMVIVKSPAADIVPSESPDTRVFVEYIPAPRIVLPHGVTSSAINRTKVRLYDNAVISKSYQNGEKVVLTGNATSGYTPRFMECICANGHDDAIIKLP